MVVVLLTELSFDQSHVEAFSDTRGALAWGGSIAVRKRTRAKEIHDWEIHDQLG